METSIFRRVPKEPFTWKRIQPYGLALINSLAALGVTLLLQPLLLRTPLMMLYLAVVASAWFGGRGPGLFSVLLTVIFAEGFIIVGANAQTSIWMDAVPLTFYTVAGLASVALIEQLRGRTFVLREKDRQLTDFMENATVGMHWLADDGTVVWANSAQASLLGCTVAGYVGKKFQTFHVDRDEADDLLQRLLRRERIESFETRLRAADGSVKTVLLDADVFWRGQEFVHARCFVRDLTARKSMEEALRQSELRFRQLAENINVVFWLWSPHERQFLYVSQVYEKVWGRSCASLLADPKSFLGTIHEEDRAAVKEKIRTQESGTPTALEYRIIRPDGAVRWVRDQAFPLSDQAGQVHRIAGLTEDITEQKEIALRVLASETKFRAVFENSLDAIGVSCEGRLVMVNPALLRLFGYRDARELQGRPVIDLVAPSEKTVVQEYASRRESGATAPSNYETRGVRQDGDEFDIEADVSLFTLNGRRQNLFILRDVTERKRAREALRKSEAGLRLAQRIGRIGSWEADLEKNTLVWSEETYRIFGCRPETFTPTEQGFFALCHPEDRANIRARADEALQHRKHYNVDYRIACPNGVERFVVQQARIVRNPEGTPIQMIGTVQDITERCLAEESLRESEERFRILFERSPEAIFILDPHDPDRLLPVVDCNEVACRQHGCERVELLGHPLPVLRQDPGAFGPVAEFIARVRREQPLVIETLHPREDEAILAIESRISLITLGQRELLLVMDRDVSERRKAEGAIQKLNEALEARVRERTSQLEAANRELEAFSYSISHDLRAPVRAITGFSRIVQDEHASGLDKEALRLLRVIHSNAQRMGQLIDDLLAFSKVTGRAPHFAPVDMTALAQSVADEQTEGTGRKTALKINELPAAAGDGSLLRQVLANLIGNALKFSRLSDEPVVEIGGWREEHQVVYFVRDNGVGFDMRYADKLFKVFQRLHKAEQFEGTGVGLAIVQRIVARHGGRVWVQSEPNAGATFFFSLPHQECVLPSPPGRGIEGEG